jgi:hypothetical protein
MFIIMVIKAYLIKKWEELARSLISFIHIM